ncbi:uncharacterized protein METZ01_LOCUS174991 [marine metagenome]|uniref:Uncharacterized protein n=1 Tax=marine metagenome TaxID=408172 RepID=A0A382C9U1_9ZZZZ
MKNNPDKIVKKVSSSVEKNADGTADGEVD